MTQSELTADMLARMDTWDGTALVGIIFGGLISAVILYFIIRLAVTHAIVAARRADVAPAAAPSTRAEPLGRDDA